jgi:hypothetical protein
MNTKRSGKSVLKSDQDFLEGLIGGPLTLGAALSGIRENRDRG